MPLYAMIDNDPRWKLEVVAENVPIQINDQWLEFATIKTCVLDGTTVYFVGHDRFFRSATSSERIYTPGIEQYLFFSSTVVRLPEILDWLPEVVHCNDWHTGFVPVLMREKMGATYNDTGSLFTIHNLAYQGEFGPEILDALALPRALFVPEHLETWGAVNFLKSGCVYSDQVNTVSPTYAREVQTPEFGAKLEGLMIHLAEQGRLSGILNGIGTDFFDPATDRFLPAHYCAGDPRGKAACREHLLREIGMDPIPGALLAGTVTRLSSQKGLHLLTEAAPKLFQFPVQLVIQGLGDPGIIADLRRLQNVYPNNIRFFEKFDEDLAQRIYGGADAFAMPSLFEPCGLGQLIAMRYGTVPIVRATGGLADTVFEGKNGFVFTEKSADDLVQAFARTHKAHQNPSSWAQLVKSGMSGEYGWESSAREYETIYRTAIDASGSVELKFA